MGTFPDSHTALSNQSVPSMTEIARERGVTVSAISHMLRRQRGGLTCSHRRRGTTMTDHDQYRLLVRIAEHLHAASTAATQLPGGDPLMTKIAEAARLADAWRCDQEAELDESRRPGCAR